MLLEEFRSLPVVGSGMAASSGLFTCYALIPTGHVSPGHMTIELIINNEKKEEIKEPEEIKEEPKVEEVIPVPEPQPEPTPIVEVPKEPEPKKEPKPKPAKKPKKKIPRPKRQPNNYKSRKRDDRDVFHVTPTKGQSYWLYRPSGPLNFSFRFRDTDFSQINTENIKIKLFKRSAWEDERLWKDEYTSRLSQPQVEELFQDLDPNKTKQLLYSLSVRRNWRKHIGDHYTSDRVNTLDRKLWYMDIEIKYFTEFQDLKNYVQAKVDNCRDDEPCIAKESELSILPQDKISFFSN